MPINRNILKSYAPQARREFIRAVTDRASALGLSQKKIEPVEVKGDVAMIAGRPFPKDVADRRKKLEARIKLKGFTQVMEEVAYTWFNRFTALRYMELHDYLGHGYRVLSNPSGSDIPEILEKATSVDLPGLDKDKVAELRLAGDKDAELYRMLLVRQCNALHRVMPTLFEAVNDATELLLPENLLQTNSPIRKLVNDIPEENWDEIEIVGWLYQFYISEKKDQVIGKVVKSEDIPAATQLFTPNWIVKYMVQNTVGRKWLMTYPASAIKGKMEFYIEPAEQEAEVQAKLDAITPKELNPEELTFMDPACGSGHILAEAYDLFKEIYLERGYRTRDIPRLILEKNLYGLDIDDRAAQLARFTVLMKARADDRRILDPEKPVQLNIMAIQESKGLDVDEVAKVLLRERVKEIGGKGAQQLSLVQPKASQASLSTSDKPDVSKEELYSLLYLFVDGKTFGSLLTVHDRLKDALPRLEKLVTKALTASDMESRRWAEALVPLVSQAKLIASQYDFAVANPPYMGSKGFVGDLKDYAKDNFTSSADLCDMFIERCSKFTNHKGIASLITMHSWMFLSKERREALRNYLVNNIQIENLAHLGSGAFTEISGEVVQTVVFSFSKNTFDQFLGVYHRLVHLSEKDKIASLKNGNNKYISSQEVFGGIPGSPIAYWASKEVLDSYSKGTLLRDVFKAKVGLNTGNNDRFLRYWFEVRFSDICFNASSVEDAAKIHKKWFPYNKGGGHRKWYGNRELVINWENDGLELKQLAVERNNGRHWSRYIQNLMFMFKEGITWSDISTREFAARYCESGFMFDVKGSSGFSDGANIQYVLSLLCSSSATKFMEFLNPTTTFQVGDISRIPLLENDSNMITDQSSKLISIYKEDWDSFEFSWDFLQLWKTPSKVTAETFDSIKTEKKSILASASELEGGIDRYFSQLYGFSESEERFENRHLDAPSHEDLTLRLISYAIGCMMGRYSLDEPGLIYAHSGNEGFDPSRYTTFPADEDGIVPVMDDDWFEDDATNRFEEFLKVAWSSEALDENLKFVADSLDPKRGETPIDTIRRFISQKFFKDHHLKVYKKRPIYWLFSSGKQRAFECLVYLHRYNENTLARMRAMYVTPLQGKYNARIEYLEKELPAASSTSAAKKLQNELAAMRKKQQELREFDELLRHYADQRISLDLDDGVKVNYGKFGNLLAEVKAVTGEKAE